ncbi:oxidative stress defense protein [Photobacterium leiognathi subsp. mandapamensis]|uniref:oxidative stress defense protein n=1 Tax=Photobacterium leiognathi TaxID=553611 RepID=UPI003AF3AD91
MKKHLLAILLSTSALISTGAVAADLSFPHLETTGRGEVVVKPDMAVFSVDVVATKPTASEAKQAADQAVTKFIERLTKAGVERKNINSANISLSAQYRYPKDQAPEFTGFKATRNVVVTVYKLENLNTYLDGALGDGINQINNITLKVKDQKKYQEEARQAAIANAKEMAASLAKGFGDKVEGVWQIDYNTASRPMPYRMANYVGSAMQDSAAINQSYSENNIVISDSVNVIFKLAK